MTTPTGEAAGAGNVLISGASIAGPALAYWLGRYGFNPTVVEVAPALRGGGAAVDFRGPTHLTVLERMGILDDLRRLDTGGSPYSFVDETGREVARLPAEFAGGDVEVLREDLSRVLYERSRNATQYIFGDSIASMTEADDGVHVTFEKGAPRTFDLVVGADGLHSNVRRLAFGPESQFVGFLGYYVAGWDLPDHLNAGRTTLLYNVPGKLASVGGDHRDGTRARAFVVFASEPLDYDRRDLDQQKKIVADTFSGVGWQAPRLIEALWDASELYFDSISRADVNHWSTGRAALVGDAAYGATIGGMGTGMAVVGAYVLAGELAAAGGDHRSAFARYEQRLRDYATDCQKGGERTGRFLAPATSTRIRIRNRMLNSRLVSGWLLNQGQKVSSNLTLGDYPG
ncbi:FAD-dependent monooxygenase [Nonomuraea sp. NPDC049152]|uniref:FAD-dependent monooxygenase n=1 Tax=Nonomuraea sp. NPDC049152 TaxID=3154350 RepID=UPI00340AC34B